MANSGLGRLRVGIPPTRVVRVGPVCERILRLGRGSRAVARLPHLQGG